MIRLHGRLIICLTLTPTTLASCNVSTADSSLRMAEAEQVSAADEYIVFHSWDGTIESFLQDNPQGGFITRRNQLFFAAPGARPDDLLASIGASLATVAIWSAAGLPDDWKFYDVSAATEIPERISALLGRHNVFDGPRCYSATLFAVDYLAAPVDISSAGFRNWAISSLVEEISASELRAGDVIALGALGAGIPVEHVAFMVTDVVVFHKASPINEAPYELLTLDSFRHRYPSLNQQFRYFRQKRSIPEHVSALGAAMPAQAATILAELAELERGYISFSLTRVDDASFPFDLPEAEDEAWTNDFDHLVKRMRSFGEENLPLVEMHLEAATVNPDLAVIWRALKDRLSALRGASGPFD